MLVTSTTIFAAQLFLYLLEFSDLCCALGLLPLQPQEVCLLRSAGIKPLQKLLSLCIKVPCPVPRSTLSKADGFTVVTGQTLGQLSAPKCPLVSAAPTLACRKPIRLCPSVRSGEAFRGMGKSATSHASGTAPRSAP